MDIEERLTKYRARKQREAYVNKVTENIKSVFRVRRSQIKPMLSDEEDVSSENKELLVNEAEEIDIISSEEEEQEEESTELSYLTIVTYILYFVLWATLFAIFVKLQFGWVFVITSALVGICLNTRTKPKKKNEVSAYSVFNKNCESIDGTLKAEQFEREIRYGSGSVR